MANTRLTRAGQVAARYLRKFVQVTGIAFSINGARTRSDLAPTITFGTGLPGGTAPNGSLYIRTDGTDGDDSVHLRVAGAWISFKGQTA